MSQKIDYMKMTPEQAEFQHERFKRVLKEAVDVLGYNEIAELFAVSPPTIRRWVEGTNKPYPIVLDVVLDETEALIENHFQDTVEIMCNRIGADAIASMCDVSVSSVKRWAEKKHVPVELIRRHVRAKLESHIEADKREFVEKVRSYLDRLDMSDSEVALKLHVAPYTLGRWKEGKNMPYPKAAQSVLQRLDALCDDNS